MFGHKGQVIHCPCSCSATCQGAHLWGKVASPLRGGSWSGMSVEGGREWHICRGMVDFFRPCLVNVQGVASVGGGQSEQILC